MDASAPSSSQDREQPQLDWLIGGEMGRRVREMAWTETLLGDISEWPTSLKSALSICVGSRFPIAIYWGAELTLLYNDAWSPILGGKHPWALGRSAREVWPEIWDAIGPMFEQVMTTGEATYAEDSLLLMRRHGYTEECYFNFTFTPIRGPAGAVEGVFNAVIETTYRVLDERRTKALSHLADGLAELRSPEEICARAAVLLAAAERDVPFCAVYLGGDGGPPRLVAEQGTGERGLRLPALAQAEDSWPFAQAEASRRAQLVSGLTAAGAHAEPVDAAVVVPLAVPGGSAAGSGFLVVGVNPRRAFDEAYQRFVERAALQLTGALSACLAFEAERRRAEALAELDRAKTAFFSNVSHEFRTPLTLMLGPTEEALASPERVLREEALEMVHRNQLRLMRLVNELLDFSRLEAGRARATFTPLDLARSTRELVSSFASAVERAGIELLVECDALPEPVFVDVALWERIVLNLLSNALKFTFAGRISVRLRQERSQVLLSIADTGIGIAEADLSRIFERFYRVDGARSRTHEGTGIGLSLVRELAELHGGEVSVRSQLDRGAEFTVALRLGSAHLPPDQVSKALAPSDSRSVAGYVAEAQRWLLPGPREATTAPAAQVGGVRARILVADDNADMREYVTRLLAEHWEVHTAADGNSALQALERSEFDLLVSDVMMPGRSGFDLLSAVRGSPALAGLPVLLLSARAGAEASVHALQAGADDYVVKPFSAQELIARVRSRIEIGAAHRRLTQARSRLRAQLEQAPFPISVVVGPDFTFELANARYRQMVGGRELQGKPFREAFPELTDDAPVLGMLRSVVATGEAYSADEYCVPLDRTESGVLEDAFFKFTCQPIRGVEGELEGLMTVAIDVTEQVGARRALEGARAEAENANRAKDEFLAMLGHELRNPLSPIVSALQLLEMKGHTEREFSVIKRQVDHLSRLVDDLLDISRITRGNLELRRERFELGPVVLRAVEMASPLVSAQRQKVQLDVATEGVMIEGDPDRMAQVVVNLITNACKYSPQATEIRVFAGNVAGRAQIGVADAGYGIPPEVLERIFDRFFQQQQSIDRRRGGLGLGLAIVKSLVEMHGGTVTAWSEGLGKGSVFTVELPLAGDARVGELPAAGERREVRAGVCGRVMVVDDNRDAADTLAQLLVGSGCEVEVANDGPAALAVAERFEPQICLLDIGLPGMDGLELARRLRQEPRLSSSILIAVTGYGQEVDRRRSASAGFDAHLTKPVTLAAVERAVQQVKRG